MRPVQDRTHVVIVGGGVIGLSTAISLLDHPEQPYAVTIIAKDLPDLDERTYTSLGREYGPAAPASYASAWAGAHHVSDATTEGGILRDRITFETLDMLADASPLAANALPWSRQLELWSKGAQCEPKSVEWYPEYNVIKDAPGNVEFACSLCTRNFNIPLYLPMLYGYVLKLGGRALQHSASSLDQAVQLATAADSENGTRDILHVGPSGNLVRGPMDLAKPALVIATPGQGAKELVGDADVLTLRGQILLVKAPWCTPEAVMADVLGEASQEAKKEHWCHEAGVSRVGGAGFRDTYMIPRGQGHFIVGGTRLADDDSVEARPETTEEILERMLLLVPSLIHPTQRLSSFTHPIFTSTSRDSASNLKEKLSETSQADKPPPLASFVDIIDVNVGMRPARRGGPRIERASEKDETHWLPDSRLPLVYSYGFGGTGYQGSWGAAFETRALVDEALGRTQASKTAKWRELETGTLSVPSSAWLQDNAVIARSPRS